MKAMVFIVASQYGCGLFRVRVGAVILTLALIVTVLGTREGTLRTEDLQTTRVFRFITSESYFQIPQRSCCISNPF